MITKKSIASGSEDLVHQMRKAKLRKKISDQRPTNKATASDSEYRQG